MIDTVKLVAQIEKDTYDKICYYSNIQTKFNKSTGEIFYQITSDSLEGSYDSRLSVHVGVGSKYDFVNKYYIEIEGSFHKIMRGQNAFDGFTRLDIIAMKFKFMVEDYYDIILPDWQDFFLKRIDITRTFDLGTNDQVRKYIGCLSNLSFPRRKVDYHDSPSDNSIYTAGTYTTLKIYNKLLEFKKHDRKKLLEFKDFNILEFEKKIQGFVRFEVEVKSKKLSDYFNKKNVKVTDIQYSNLLKIWREEFMKLLKFENNELNFVKVRTKEDVKQRLYDEYKPRLANSLYQFFILVINEGYDKVKEVTSETTFYRKLKQLKKVGIDISQTDSFSIEVPDMNNLVDFDPFSWEEVS